MEYSVNDNWLETLLVDAQAAGWCMRPFCTTCGCTEFRLACWAAAARQAGVAKDFKSAGPRNFFADVSRFERDVLVRTLVAGLRRLSQKWCRSDAFRTIILELDPPLQRHGVPITLDDELADTPAGMALDRMRAHSESVRKARDEKEAYESPQAAEERRRAKREKKANAHDRRIFKSSQRNAQRLELLATLATLSPLERLKRFATDSSLNLDSVSADLIPYQQDDFTGLEDAMAVALIMRIDRRKGPWGRLRRLIENSAGR